MVPGTSADDCTRRQPQNSLLGWRTSPRAGTWPTPGTRTCSRLGLSLARCGGGAKLKPSWHLPPSSHILEGQERRGVGSREGGGARRGPCTPGRSAGDSGTRRALEAPRPSPGTDTLPQGELGAQKVATSPGPVAGFAGRQMSPPPLPDTNSPSVTGAPGRPCCPPRAPGAPRDAPLGSARPGSAQGMPRPQLLRGRHTAGGRLHCARSSLPGPLWRQRGSGQSRLPGP